MLSGSFKPWGLLHWVLPRIPIQNWDVLGCLSTEDRCIATFRELGAQGLVNHAKFLEIEDPPSQYTDTVTAKRNEMRAHFGVIRATGKEIDAHTLLEPYGTFVDSVNAFCGSSNGNVVVDISSFPKRYFFPIVKLLLNSKQITNLVATYTVPLKYYAGDLAENPEPWRNLPLFMPDTHPDPSIDVALVGVGFLPFSLPELLRDDYEDVDIKYFFPFPPGPPNYQRTWEFVRMIGKSSPIRSPRHLIRVEAINTPDAFNHICSETENGNKKALFAPYGPKPISLAMCIYASLTNSPVYYTQPRLYHPEYSTGVAKVNGRDLTYAYCLRINGKNFYAL